MGVDMRPEAENLFTSLELSKKLDEAGIPKTNHWWWSKPPGGRWRVFGGFGEPSCEHHPAFLAEELLTILPQAIYYQDDTGGFCGLWMDRPADAYHLGYENVPSLTQYDQSLANACAKLYLALKEKGLIGGQDSPADAYTAVMGLAELGERYGAQGPHDLSENHDDYLYGDKEDHQP